MAAAKFLNLLAVSSLAILACSFGATPANALSDPLAAHHLAARHNHHAIAKRHNRRQETQYCRARPSTTVEAAPTTWSSTPSSSSSSSEAPASTQTSSSGGNQVGGVASTWGKTGVAWANGDANDISLFKPANGATYYSWSPIKASAASAAGFKFAAMCWGWNQVSQFQELVNQGYTDIVFGMNEPNEPSQSNMSPESGAELWKTYIEPLHYEGYTLISPACTSAPSGKQWLQDFIAACNGGCTLDGIALHYYDVSADGFIAYVEDFHNTFQKAIYVTEFACQNFNGGAQASMDEIWAFMIKTVQWMDATDYVAYYAWFGVMRDMQNVNPLNRLMTEDGNGLTELGHWYFGNHA